MTEDTGNQLHSGMMMIRSGLNRIHPIGGGKNLRFLLAKHLKGAQYEGPIQWQSKLFTIVVSSTIFAIGVYLVVVYPSKETSDFLILGIFFICTGASMLYISGAGLVRDIGTWHSRRKEMQYMGKAVAVQPPPASTPPASDTDVMSVIDIETMKEKEYRQNSEEKQWVDDPDVPLTNLSTTDGQPQAETKLKNLSISGVLVHRPESAEEHECGKSAEAQRSWSSSTSSNFRQNVGD